MGYETRFSLKWETIEAPAKYDLPDDLNKRIGDWIEGNEEMDYALCRDGSASDSAKWYEWQQDMRKMSANFPGVLFTLFGEGEENDDIWRAYFLNGKCQEERAQILIADFNPKLLR